MSFRQSCLGVLGFAFFFSGGSLGAEDKPLMRIEQDDATIQVFRGERIIFQYNKVPTKEAAEHEPHFSRDGYIHPIYSPQGKEVTGDFAEDHKHQHGLFFAWTRTRLGKQKAEFWNQKLEQGKIEYSRTLKSISGREQCFFVVEHLWDAVAKDGSRSPALKETWKVTARDAGDEIFLFDIESVQWQRGDQPLTIEKYHYGGMAIRGNDQWLLEKDQEDAEATLRTDEGLERVEGNHSRPRWVTMSGPIDGEYAGVTVMGHPSNFRFPQWVRLHPTKPYFVFAPMVEEPFQIEGGKPYISRYRYVVSDKELAKERLEQIYKEWAKEE